jgi:hypothetical protein
MQPYGGYCSFFFSFFEEIPFNILKETNGSNVQGYNESLIHQVRDTAVRFLHPSQIDEDHYKIQLLKNLDKQKETSTLT